MSAIPPYTPRFSLLWSFLIVVFYFWICVTLYKWNLQGHFIFFFSSHIETYGKCRHSHSYKSDENLFSCSCSWKHLDYNLEVHIIKENGYSIYFPYVKRCKGNEWLKEIELDLLHICRQSIRCSSGLGFCNI